MTEPALTWHSFDLYDPGSGPIELRYKPRTEKVNLRFETEWRGDPATIEMEATRTHSYDGEWRGGPGLDWWIMGRQALSAAGSSLTDTARSRLTDRHRPDVETWLASPAYGPSAHRALIFAVAEVGKSLRGYSDPPSRDLRAALEANRDRLTEDDQRRLLTVADAYDTYIKTLNDLKGSP